VNGARFSHLAYLLPVLLGISVADWSGVENKVEAGCMRPPHAISRLLSLRGVATWLVQGTILRKKAETRRMRYSIECVAPVHRCLRNMFIYTRYVA